MLPMVRDVQAATARHYGVPLASMWEWERKNSGPRQVAMALSREITGKSYHLIGSRFDRDHTTVMYAERKVRRLTQSDPALAAKVAAIREELAA